MNARRPTWLLICLSALMSVSLIGSPLAFADGDDGSNHARVQQARDRDNDADDVHRNLAEVRLNRLIDAIDADVAILSRIRVDEDGDNDADDIRFDDVRAISLATIESHLSSSAATRLTNALDAHSGALQTFLNGGSAQASAIDSVLNDAGVSPSSALAIFPLRNGRLIVITS